MNMVLSDNKVIKNYDTLETGKKLYFRTHLCIFHLESQPAFMWASGTLNSYFKNYLISSIN